MSDFDSTPSFYNTDNTFEKYLGQTSYYLGLQDAVTKLIEEADPDGVIEMGSGTGETAFKLSNTFPNLNIVGIDNREKVIRVSRDRLEDVNAPNLRFEVSDFRDYVMEAELPDMLVFLYSFHHIPDPLDCKEEFLEDCFTNLDPGSYVCIAETFLTSEGRSERADREVRTTWADRGLEGYASTFWSALDGVDQESIERAQEIGEFSRDHELKAGENVLHRDEEYLVTMDWVTDAASNTGFNVVLAEPRNALGEGVVLLQKP